MGIKNRLLAIGISASLLISIPAIPGCAKKSGAKSVGKHDTLEVISKLKEKTEDEKYHLQGEIQFLDGENCLINSFHEEMRELVNALCDADMKYVDDWDPSKIEYPVYEFYLQALDSTVEDYSQMTDEEIKNVHFEWNAFWSNGYLITWTGDVLTCNIDMPKISKSFGEFFESKYAREMMFVYSRVNAYWNGKWNPENMMTLDDYLKKRYTENDWNIREAQGWSAKFKSLDEKKLTVTITNESVSELTYGNGGANIVKKINGTWYYVPADPTIAHMAYTALGYILPEGQSVDLPLTYAPLPEGDYAVLVDLGTEGQGQFEYALAKFSV